MFSGLPLSSSNPAGIMNVTRELSSTVKTGKINKINLIIELYNKL